MEYRDSSTPWISIDARWTERGNNVSLTSRFESFVASFSMFGSLTCSGCWNGCSSNICMLGVSWTDMLEGDGRE